MLRAGFFYFKNWGDLCYHMDMNSKTLGWIGMLVGSAIGGALPMLWGDSAFSFSSILLSGVGAIAGLYIGFKMGQ